MKGERPNSLALALKGFLSDYLPRVRGTSPHTILSYRDAIKLLLVHLSRKKGIPVANLTIEEIGVRSSRDGFFKRYSYENGNKSALPPSEIDQGDIKKAA